MIDRRAECTLFSGLPRPYRAGFREKFRLSDATYETIETDGGVPVKAWVRGVPMEDEARAQLTNVARLPFIHRWVAAMPDVHYGIGATVGSVIPTRGAIIPAAVGVDIGCGMMAVRTDVGHGVGSAGLPGASCGRRIEKAVPHGRTDHGGRNDKGAWREVAGEGRGRPGESVRPGIRVRSTSPRVTSVIDRKVEPRGSSSGPSVRATTSSNSVSTSPHRLWVMLHSGSRGVGNRIGMLLHQARAERHEASDRQPARTRTSPTSRKGAEHFDDYVDAVDWAQRFAALNRELMMDAVIGAVARCRGVRRFKADAMVVNCHHNYVAREHHYGHDVFVTRKGAVRAGDGDLGIIPGSMGARSFIVRGKGQPESFSSCSHGAGRSMSRKEAKRRFTLVDHEQATRGVECRKDELVIDETPGAYKDIDRVMEAQKDLVDVVHTLKQVVCVKG